MELAENRSKKKNKHLKKECKKKYEGCLNEQSIRLEIDKYRNVLKI